LVARAFLSWTGADDRWTVENLTENLASDVLRFGGLDVDRATLDKMGVQDDDRPVVRTHAGEWKLGDKVWVDGSEYYPWQGTIRSFSDDGKEARVFDEDDKPLTCKIEWLRTKKPKARKES
jgi:hypothetical protein